MEFRGTLGLSEDELRRVFTERFGAAPPAGARGRDRGGAPRLLPRPRLPVGAGHAADRGNAQPRSRDDGVRHRRRVARDDRPRRRRRDRRQRIVRWPAACRCPRRRPLRQRRDHPRAAIATRRRCAPAASTRRGRCTPPASSPTAPRPSGSPSTAARVISIAFAGDPLPEAERERLVPVRAEGSADEDLLEDANAAIEEYLQARGYRDAVVEYAAHRRRGCRHHHLQDRPRSALRRR